MPEEKSEHGRRLDNVEAEARAQASDLRDINELVRGIAESVRGLVKAQELSWDRHERSESKQATFNASAAESLSLLTGFQRVIEERHAVSIRLEERNEKLKRARELAVISASLALIVAIVKVVLLGGF